MENDQPQGIAAKTGIMIIYPFTAAHFIPFV
jgi:hypothetical protein